MDRSLYQRAQCARSHAQVSRFAQQQTSHSRGEAVIIPIDAYIAAEVEGQMAYCSGIPRLRNPYTPSLTDALEATRERAWRQGWGAAASSDGRVT